MKTLLFLFSAAAAFALNAAVASADTPPIRHLVYTFDVTLGTTSTIHSSGIGGDGDVTGISNYQAGTSDKGQIVIDVLAVQPDTGLVVRITEQARQTRSSAPTQCVVYGNGSVVCDQSKGGPNEEEMSLLRVLGRNFVDRTAIDAKNHWQFAQSSPDASETNDYTIAGDTNGVLSIVMQRQLKVTGGQAFTAVTNGNISYNEKLSVPLSLKEDTVTRRNTGENNYDRIEQQMTLTLASDSMQQTAGH